jgi:hypothetical protein
MLVYGRAGVGKTVLAGTASLVPEMCPVLFVDVEGGTMSVAARNMDVDVVRVQGWDDMQVVYDELYKGNVQYQTVVLDSLTEIQKFSMLEIMEKLVKVERDRDPEIPGLREWGKNIEQIRRLVRAFRDLPVNTIFTALMMENRNPRTGLTVKAPQLSGKLSGEVAGFLDIVLFMYLKNVEGEQQRLLLSQQTEDTVAKDRSDRLPQVMVNPTMPELHELLTHGQVIETTAAS